MNFVTQLFAVTAMNLRGIRTRAGTSAVIVIGIACVVFVVLSILSMSEGFRTALVDLGREDRAIVLRQGARFAGGSFISRDNAVTIMDAEGVRKNADGKPLAAADMIGMAPVTKKKDGFDAMLTLYGISEGGVGGIPGFKLVEGSLFQPAVHELIVGRSAQQQFADLEIGKAVTLPQGDWKIVGAFTAATPLAEAMLIGDADTMMSAFQRTAFSTVQVELESPAAFDRFKAALTSNPTLNVDVKRQTEYLAENAKQLTDLLGFVTVTLGTIMAVGAIIGALNTMYAAVSARRREIGTLRAIGFGATPVVISVLVEAILLAAAGAVLGGVMAWLVFDGVPRTIGGGVIHLRVSGGLLLSALMFGGAIGFLGGVFPAARAARLSIIDALRAR